MQNFLHYLRCNTGPYINEYKFINEKIKCPDSIGYGPLVEYVQLTFDGLWEVTVLIGILFLTILIIFLIFSKKFVLDSFYFNLTWFSFFNIFAEYRYNRIFIYLLFD